MAKKLINETEAAIILLQMATGLTAEQVITEFNVPKSQSKPNPKRRRSTPKSRSSSGSPPPSKIARVERLDRTSTDSDDYTVSRDRNIAAEKQRSTNLKRIGMSLRNTLRIPAKYR